MFLVRSSKFRHVFGSPAKKEDCYEGIKITKNAHDGCFCAVNPLYIAIVTESAGGGAFLVIPLKQTGRVVPSFAPKVVGHRGPVMDIKWSPFNDRVIASCSEDTTIKVWRIPQDGFIGNLTEWQADLQGHTKKCCYIEWHPTAEDIILSAGADFKCMLWNAGTEECIRVISVHPDTIFSIAWNRDGILFATTCKDRNIRVIDSRLGSVVTQGAGHTGSKSSKAVFVDKKRLFTCGFSKMSERQYALWDIDDLSRPLKLEVIDASSGVLIPYYDYDTKVIFLAGRGDGNIRYYEIVADPPYVHYLNQYLSGCPQKGFGYMPKRGVSTTKCELFRFYKLHSLKDLCEPLSMIVPRKSEQFQEDIYPPTASPHRSLTAAEWLSGQNRDPLLISMKDGQECNSGDASPVAKRAMCQNNVHTKTTQLDNNLATKPGDQSATTSSSSIGSLQRGASVTSTGSTNKVPASLLNIHRLSSIGDGQQFLQCEPVNDKIHLFEARNTTAHNDVTSSSTSEPGRADKKRVLASGCSLGSNHNNNNEAGFDSPGRARHEIEGLGAHSVLLRSGSGPQTEAELRKAYYSQVEEIFGLKEQLCVKEKRIRQLEEEVKILKKVSSPTEVSALS